MDPQRTIKKVYKDEGTDEWVIEEVIVQRITIDQLVVDMIGLEDDIRFYSSKIDELRKKLLDTTDGVEMIGIESEIERMNSLLQNRKDRLRETKDLLGQMREEKNLDNPDRPR